MPNDNWLPSGYLANGNEIPAAKIEVYRYDDNPEVEVEERFELLPSVECLGVEQYLGARPSTAVFRYRFGDGNESSPPYWEIAASSLRTDYSQSVELDDRLLVIATQKLLDGSDGEERVLLFDGFVREPGLTIEGGLDADIEEYDFIAQGVGIKHLESAIVGSKWYTFESGVDYVDTGIPAMFNEKGLWNCSLFDVGNLDGDPSYSYPGFADPDLDGLNPDRIWTLPKAIAYLMYGMQDATLTGLVSVTDRATIDSAFLARIPIDGDEYDPTNPATYTTADIPASSVPLNGRMWPSVVEAMIADKGFSVVWDSYLNEVDGAPSNLFKFIDHELADIVNVYLQERDEPLDLDDSNLGAAALRLDCGQAINEWVVHGELEQWEASFILLAGFPTEVGDADPAEVEKYDKDHPDFLTDNRNRHRLFLFGEDVTADLYIPGDNVLLNQDELDWDTQDYLDPLLGSLDGDYVMRRRPALSKLLSKAIDGSDQSPVLSYSLDYVGPSGGLWDGTGTWFPIQGGYDLLKDRLGIWVNVENPSSWAVGAQQDDPAARTHLNVPQSLSDPDPNIGDPNPFFSLMLTAVIEGDRVAGYNAERDVNLAVLPSTNRRVVDASDRYFLQRVHYPSLFNDTLATIVVRDDSDLAEAEAESLKRASQQGSITGTLLIPRFTAMYQCGQRIRAIEGRGVVLRTDRDQDGHGNYPMIQSIRYHLAGPQTVALSVSDANIIKRPKKANERTKFLPRGRARRLRPGAKGR